jgi:hypothetical protein
LPRDYKQIRKYLRTVHERQMYLVPSQTKPTAASYLFVVEKGPELLFAQEALGIICAPGYIIAAL